MSKYYNELSTNTAIGCCAERGKAWHWRKGDDNHFDGPVPMPRVRKMLGFQPLVIPHTYPFNGEIRTSDRVDIVHGDTGDLLGVFSDGYTPHPYEETLVDKTEQLLDDGLCVESCGCLGGGKIAWCQVGLPQTVKVDGVGEAFRPSLLVASSLDGTIASTWKKCFTRVVCDNTLGAGLAERTEQVVKVKHTSGSAGKLDLLTARATLGIIFEMADDFTRAIQEMTSKTVTDRQWQQFLDAHVGERPTDKGRSQTMYDNHRDKLVDLYKTDERVAPWSGTVWGVVQAVSTYEQHLATVKNMHPVFRTMTNAIKVDRQGRSAIDRQDTDTLQTLALVGVK